MEQRKPVTRAEPMEGYGPQPAAGLPLADYLRMLRARKWAFLTTFALVLGAATVLTFAATPIYRGTSLVMIEPRRPNVANVEAIYDPVTSGMSVLEYYRTQFEILRSRRVTEPVIEALHVRERPEYRDARDVVEAFQRHIIVEPVRESRLVRLSVESPDRRFAAAAANAIVDRFVDENNQWTLGVSDTGLQKLREMERAMRPKHEAAARRLQQFREDNNIVAIDETQSTAIEQAKLLGEELSRARAERARAVAEKQAAMEAIAAGASAVSIPSIPWREGQGYLRLELAKAAGERDALRMTYKPDHPLLQAAEARLAQVEARVALEDRSAIALIDTRVAAATRAEKELEKALAEAEARAADLGRKNVQLQLLREEAESIATSYKAIVRRIEEVEMAIAAGDKTSNIFVIDRALEPALPVRPMKRLNLALGAILGLLAGIGVCFLLEYLDHTVKSKDELERLLPHPVLGFAPPVSAETLAALGNGDGPIAPELAAARDPRSAVAESFRTIRTGLGFTLAPRAPTALVVTSAVAGDGKTFVAVNLAFALAQTGKRVLLVDADLRRPRIHAIFGLATGDRGFSTAISALPSAGSPGQDRSTLAPGIVQPSAIAGLDVLTAGPLPPNPGELLASEAVKDFLARALGTYDWVILDAPPVAAVADAAALLGHVPHAIFVVRPFATSKHGIARAREVLAQAPGRVAGIVINTVDVPAGNGEDPYRYGHAYGYTYGADHARGGERPERRRRGQTDLIASSECKPGRRL
jgi:capsular exopolysaccharide synthesis family protein